MVFDYSPQDPRDIQLRELLFTDQMVPELVKYIEGEFARLGIDLPIVLRQHFVRPPADIPQEAVLFVHVRIDISRSSLDGDAIVVGAISLNLFRHDTSTWSVVPYELFAVPLRDELVRSTLIASAKRHLAKSLIEPIARLHQQ